MPRRWWLFVLPAAVVLTWPRLISVRLYDPDEFEHLHAAWCVAHGQTPYRDFFEHHGPLTYYFLAPFVAWMGDTPSLLTVHRILAAMWVVATAAGVAGWFHRRPFACLGVAFLWLTSFPWFLEKAVEGRPDVPAMALMVWAAWLTRRAAHSSGYGWAGAAGIVCGVACLFTQKAAFLSCGFALGAAVIRGDRGRNIAAPVLCAALGFAAAWGAAGIWFYYKDSFGPFLQRTLVTPATWPPHARAPDESILNRLTNPISWSPGHLVMLAAALTVGWRIRRRRRRGGSDIPWWGLVVHLLGAPLVPAYLQYYLLAAPIAAIVVGDALAARICRRPTSLLWWIGGVAALAEAWRLSGIRSILRNPYDAVDVVAMAVLAVALIVLAGATVFRGRKVGAWCCALVVAASLVPGFGRYVVYHLFWAAAGDQRKDLAAFGELSPGPVLDGFSGLGCLRPHASYWWWINHHSVPLMRKEGALREVVELIRSRSAGAVIYDEGVRSVAPGLESLLLQGYDPLSFRGRPIFLRRSDVSRTPDTAKGAP